MWIKATDGSLVNLDQCGGVRLDKWSNHPTCYVEAQTSHPLAVMLFKGNEIECLDFLERLSTKLQLIGGKI
jgi:hypothetical protein